MFDCNFQVAAVDGKVDLVVDALEKSAADKTLDKNLKTWLLKATKQAKKWRKSSKNVTNDLEPLSSKYVFKSLKKFLFCIFSNEY